MTYPMTILTI